MYEPWHRADLATTEADGTAADMVVRDRLLRAEPHTTMNSVDGAPETAMAMHLAHGLRHHYGTRLALHGVPVPVIQQLLGHADPRTSSIYTRVAAQSLIDTVTTAGLLR